MFVDQIKQTIILLLCDLSVLPRVFKDYTTKIVFMVNQLYPNSIGMSPLTITHPRLLPQSQVPPIWVVMAGSSGFGYYRLN